MHEREFEARRGMSSCYSSHKTILPLSAICPLNNQEKKRKTQKAVTHTSCLGKGPELSLKPCEAARRISKSGRSRKENIQDIENMPARSGGCTPLEILERGSNTASLSIIEKKKARRIPGEMRNSC